ncbi:ADP-ribosylglycohydrolase family protein [Deinococcus cellulosilyticus]|uniref:Dinitrogenase reductase activating glycohydrolase (DraG) n=1 Tax=Deinococcus cellulosilyticus (strain DSM 18568 / NBRC 106333 / KACC 11606 / 5516J-15) TaxID=1223518 RepID=A0A511MXA3_DEIC1|nr:ADP-ribosylglycohydrolase family protein [Deinococcus cellulosilyticus]GEM45214.1 dinitrogenase reductase activating glycohydrolase (draG) [Deinococcus cellulosilyticus NBRC 106333 = KACC 11606]
MQERIHGMLLGMAVGDALGLPYEHLPRQHAARLGHPDRMRLWLGHGMVSDDTEHALLTLEALLRSGGDVDLFQKHLARNLIQWGHLLPISAGKATLVAVSRLFVGIPPERSGVMSAGNGPLMRSLPLGLMITEPEKLRQMVRVCTRITHLDPRAERGTLVLALAARFILEHRVLQITPFLEELFNWIPEEEDPELWDLLGLLDSSLENQQSTRDFALELGLESGVSAYVYHTLPVVLHAWFSSPSNFEEAVTRVIELGGDTDTMAALVGGLVGIRVSNDGIPLEWAAQLWEPARGLAYLEKVAYSLAVNRVQDHPRASVLLSGTRQVVFHASVMGHVLRRLWWQLALKTSSSA